MGLESAGGRVGVDWECMYVCLCVCMFVCLYICVFACLCVCVFARLCVERLGPYGERPGASRSIPEASGEASGGSQQLPAASSRRQLPPAAPS